MRAVWFQFQIWKMAPSVPPPPALWATRRPPEDGFPMALDADRLYLANAAGDVRAYNRASGELAWEIETPAVVAAPIIAADRVVIAHRGSIASYEPATGQLIEERVFDGTAVNDAIVTSAGVFAIQEDGTVTALTGPATD
jgi:outer membrane protein assembly factor BamB